ncbi:MAG: LysM peptidoglycan-binding domain-containing protein [Elusimicrobia bacterium]|nr:LysM peptidoglycan-binding domain-containing protein [Elusimicrobiota bacterium]
MNKNYFYKLLFIFIFFTGSFVYPAFENISSGARPYGMGNAFTGLADDIQAVFYNPAGLTQIRYKELITSFGRPFLGLDDKSNISDGFIGYLYPIRGRESIAVSVTDLRLSSIYSENVATLSYAKDIKKNVSFGFNLKALRIKYGSDSYTEIDPVFNRDSRTSFSGDVGLFMKFTKKFSAGFSAFNLNEPNIGIAEVLPLPLKMRLGISYRPAFATICFDVEKQKDNYTYFLGSEKLIFTNDFFIREGASYSKNLINISLGFSYLPDPLKIDYAFQMPIVGIKSILGSHRISITFEFGKEIHDPYTSDLETEIDKLTKENEKLQKNLNTTTEQLSNTSSDMEKTKAQLEEIQKQKEQLEVEKRRSEYRPPVKKVTYHTVEKGDTLSSISQKYYGTSDKWQDIYNANKNKIERGTPIVGSQLIIP